MLDRVPYMALLGNVKKARIQLETPNRLNHLRDYGVGDKLIIRCVLKE
jgi:hypothetical protein